eukprot:11194524-Lingulodinium_polyedra.AAC.1
MPLKPCDCWRPSTETGLDGNEQHGVCRVPCCGLKWLWGQGGSRRVFSLHHADGTWSTAYISGDPHNQTYREVDADT